ncbi:conserved hypothetical protein [Theileria equi strain WA]|uniref:Kringle domain-containing protein n=1 Tax=Theileria equi strain WA TaxID=1537102 RepID=L1LG24_THEEQ|nr:conserved hypothetical protein [Theileria equi strain WA]EKX74219.1 conserved hypothetical protein [Theileria equi strain WA]|eukprot:XP_004833671.1 conserved hypothetical protein [Theileria equi strain WA]
MSCLSNCGSMIWCRGSNVNVKSEKKIDNKLIKKSVEKNCKISQLQESLDNLCGKDGYVARLDINDQIKCYSSATLNYDTYGDCLDDCRQKIKCKGAAKLGDKGIEIEIYDMDWDNLTNGCPCNEEFVENIITYRGCQNVTIKGNECKQWKAFLSVNHRLYPKRFFFPRNYCREIRGKSGIWCLVDIDQLEECKPIGIEPIDIQPGTVFDIWITPYIPKYRVDVIFIDSSKECGRSDLKISSNITRPYEYSPLTWNYPNENDIFYYPDSKQMEPSIVLNGFVALENMASSSKVCACLFSSFYENVNGHYRSCRDNNDYNIHIATINVNGPSIPKNATECYSSEKINFENSKGFGGIISLVKEPEALIHDYKTFMVSIDAILESGKEDAYPQELYGRINQVCAYRQIISENDDQIDLHPGESGNFVLLYQKINILEKQGMPVIVKRYTIKGYNSTRSFTMVGDYKKDKRREQSLFFRSFKITLPPLAVLICEYSTGSECTNPIAHTLNLSPVVDSQVDNGETIWRASYFNMTQRLSKINNPIDSLKAFVVKSDLTTESLGYGTLRDDVDHELGDIFPQMNIGIPYTVSNYTMHNKWDILGMHLEILEDDIFNFFTHKKQQKLGKNANLFKRYMTKFAYDVDLNVDEDNYEYPAVLSFWSYPKDDLVRIWVLRPNRLSPAYFGSLRIKSPMALELIVFTDKITAIVLSEGKVGVDLYHFTNGIFEAKLITSSCDETRKDCTKLISPSDMKVIEYYNDCIRDHLIIVSDSGLNCIILYNSSLQEVSKICRGAEISFEIFEPGYMSCTTDASDISQCIDEFGRDTNTRSLHADCFVTQTHEGSILWIKISLLDHSMELVSVYKGGNGRFNETDNGDKVRAHMLRKPVSLEAVSYGNTHLIYLIEDESPEITLLILDVENDSKIFYYGHTELKMIPYSTYVYSSKILMSKDNKNDLENQDYLMLFRVDETKSRSSGKSFGSINIVNFQDTISVSDFSYNVPDWLVINQEYKQKPITGFVGAKYNFSVSYELEIRSAEDKNSQQAKEDGDIHDWNGNLSNKNTIEIDSITGELTIKIQHISKMILPLRVTAIGVIDSKSVDLDFKVSCKDGYRFNETPKEDEVSCSVCQVGEYNSLTLIKDDISNWSKCTMCPERETTITRGSTSVSQCLCAPGYFYSAGSTPRCQPCPAGKWKSVVGLQSCNDSQCYKNSETSKIASVSEEDRECSCFKGYYYRHDAGGIKECVPCDEGYFCEGGFHGKRKKCPTNTTTLTSDTKINNTTPPKSVAECVCKMGYAIASVDRINDPTTLEHTFKLRIIDEIREMELEDTNVDINKLVCIPCGNRRYKDKIGNEDCIECPKNTFSESISATSISQCNLCDQGYFETEDVQLPCKKCTEDHFCVGSDPVDSEMKKYSGKRIKCPEHAKTIEPYEKNSNITNCLCDVGYVSGSNSVLNKCVQVPKNYYKDKVGNIPASACPNGSLTLAPGAVSKNACVCDKGYYFDNTSQHCTMCPNGKYCLGGKDENMVDRQPMDCQDTNAQTKYPGASSASECACKPGYYANTDAQNACTECPENHYKSYISNDACVRCDENSSTNGKTGATSKEQCVCDPGYYFDKSCVACDFRDKFCPGGLVLKRDSDVSTFETRPPEKCPENTEIPPGVDNASSIDYCQCSKGYAFASKDLDNNIKTCTPCPPGTYKSSVMDSNCNGLCTQNATSLQGAKSPMQCFCQMGYFYLAGGICTKCLEGSRCDGGLTNTRGITEEDVDVDIDDHTKPVAIEGYYLDKINQKLRKPDDWKFIKCPIKGACLGGGKCSKSMEHYLCSECKKGYTNNFTKGAICQKCPNMAINLSVIMVWYFILLLINIVMACLNVSAGFNRRSIHSVVIKIALNYCICTSVLNVVNFDDLNLPKSVKSFTTSWIKMFDSDDIVYYTSIDCILRSWFNLNHADSFFYAMLYMFFLPVILLFVVTVLMWTILELFKIKRYKVTTAKLALLQQSKARGLEPLAERLRDEYANERLFLIFRYIPLPGETKWTKSVHFIEDMIPIYVTVLFSVHGKITSKMLGLLDCVYIDLGRSIPGKYMLRPAMSVRCSLNPSHGYIPYLALGMTGLIIWGFGIPFLSFMVLYVNRKNLYAPDIRMKYGFLHNGFRQDYWYWETVVFTRKSLVLVIGSIVIVPSQNLSGSRIWMALVVAVIFLIIQLFYKPFDERDYFVLGKLESHSMIAWTLTLIFASLIIEVNFTDWDNMWLLGLTIVFNSLFIAEVFYELFIAYCHNVRIYNKHVDTPIIGRFYRFLSQISENIKAREPLILCSENTGSTVLVSPKPRKLDSSRKISYSEKEYFSYVITEVISFPSTNMKLDVIPTDFSEFITRLIFAVHHNESNKQKTDNIVRSIADGNLEQLVNLSMMQEGLVQTKKATDAMDIHSSFEQDETLIVNPGLMFESSVISRGIALSDFYIALSIIKLCDNKSIAKMYAAFKDYKKRMRESELRAKAARMRRAASIVEKAEIEDVDNLFCSRQDIEEMKKIIKGVKEKIEAFKRDPLKALDGQDATGENSDDFEKDLISFGFKRVG